MPLFNMRKRGAKGTVVEATPHTMLPSAPGGGYKPATSLPAGPSGPRPLTSGEKLIKSRRKEADARADMKTIGAKGTARQQRQAKARESAKVAGTPNAMTGKTVYGSQAAKTKSGSWRNLGEKK